MPLFDALVAMPMPVRAAIWMANNPHVSEYLRGLARGDIPLTHQGLHELASWRTAAHLRDLLMQHDILPRVDRHVLLFERWYQHQLHTIDQAEHVVLSRQFTTWHLLPRLHATARRRPVGPAGRNHAAGEFTTALNFLTWLADHGLTLCATTQADLGTWTVEHIKGDNRKIDSFLKWAMTNRHMPRLTMPRHPAPPRTSRSASSGA